MRLHPEARKQSTTPAPDDSPKTAYEKRATAATPPAVNSAVQTRPLGTFLIDTRYRHDQAPGIMDRLRKQHYAAVKEIDKRESGPEEKRQRLDAMVRFDPRLARESLLRRRQWPAEHHAVAESPPGGGGLPAGDHGRYQHIWRRIYGQPVDRPSPAGSEQFRKGQRSGRESGARETRLWSLCPLRRPAAHRPAVSASTRRRGSPCAGARSAT